MKIAIFFAINVLPPILLAVSGFSIFFAIAYAAIVAAYMAKRKVGPFFAGWAMESTVIIPVFLLAYWLSH